jgi:HEAT repeat protein
MVSDVKDLIEQLRSPNRSTAQAAAAALGAFRDSRAVLPLVEILGDRDRWVAWAAAQALTRIGEFAVQPLLDALGRESVAVRRQAVKALVKMADRCAVGPLVQALGDKDMLVRWGAAEALGKIGEAAVPSLIRALGDENRRVRWGAGQVLVAIGTPSVDGLVEALGSESVAVRRGGAQTLGRIGDRRAVGPLILRAGDPDKGVAKSAVRALTMLDPRRCAADRFHLDKSLQDGIILEKT